MDTKLIVIAIMIGAVGATLAGTMISFGNANLSSAQNKWRTHDGPGWNGSGNDNLPII